MVKAKINQCKHYPFSTDLTIRVSDLNYGAHLGYDKILTLAHQARIIFFEQLGVTELSIGKTTEEENVGIVVVDAAVNYRGEGFLNDILVFEICPIEIGMVSFRLSHKITNKKTGKDIAAAEFGFVAFDYKNRRPSRLPKSFFDKLTKSSKNA